VNPVFDARDYCILKKTLARAPEEAFRPPGGKPLIISRSGDAIFLNRVLAQ
jgi:hypothetical protein